MSRPVAVPAASKPQAAVRRNGVLDILPQFDASLRKAPGYLVTYHRVGKGAGVQKARQVASTKELFGFLEGLGLRLSRPEVRNALGQLYARGATSLEEIWLSDEELRHLGLA